MTELRTPKQAAARLQMSVEQLTAFARDGDIRYINTGRGKKIPRRMFTDRDLDDFAVEHKAKAVPTSLYRHFDAGGKLLYVGISLHVFVRLIRHRKRSHWFSQLARIEVEHYPSREAALRAGREAIRSEGPLYNILGRAARLADRCGLERDSRGRRRHRSGRARV